MTRRRIWVSSALTGLAAAWLAVGGCGTRAGKGAAQGAGTGAIAGSQVEKPAQSSEPAAQAGEDRFAKLREEITALGNLREKFDRPRVCAS